MLFNTHRSLSPCLLYNTLWAEAALEYCGVLLLEMDKQLGWSTRAQMNLVDCLLMNLLVSPLIMSLWCMNRQRAKNQSADLFTALNLPFEPCIDCPRRRCVVSWVKCHWNEVNHVLKPTNSFAWGPENSALKHETRIINNASPLGCFYFCLLIIPDNSIVCAKWTGVESGSIMCVENWVKFCWV